MNELAHLGKDQEKEWEEYMEALIEAFEYGKTGTSIIPPFMYYDENKGEWRLND